MKGASWGPFRAKFATVGGAKTTAYQNDTIMKAAEGREKEVTTKVTARYRSLLRDRARAMLPYDARKDQPDLKVAAKLALYEDALAEVQAARSLRLAKLAELRAAQPAAKPALAKDLAALTVRYEEVVVRSSFYADQAYYARGSLLVVVARKKEAGGQNANAAAGFDEPTLTVEEFYQSMIEQAGDLFKDLGHASAHKWTVPKAAIKASKYADRFFDAAITTLDQLPATLGATERANATALAADLKAARAINAILYQLRLANAAWNEAEATAQLKKLGIRDLGDFRSKYRDWCAKVIIFKRLSENRDKP